MRNGHRHRVFFVVNIPLNHRQGRGAGGWSVGWGNTDGTWWIVLGVEEDVSLLAGSERLVFFVGHGCHPIFSERRQSTPYGISSGTSRAGVYLGHTGQEEGHVIFYLFFAMCDQISNLGRRCCSSHHHAHQKHHTTPHQQTILF